MQTRYENEYHSETGSTQQERSEDQVQQDLNTERVYDVIDTPAVVHNTTTTAREEASTESHIDRQNQTRLDRNQEDPTNTHIYHILEQQSEEHVKLKDHKQQAPYEDPVTHIYHILEQQNEEHVELKDHKPAVEYEDPVTHIYHILEQQSEDHVELKDDKPAVAYEDPVTNMAVCHP